MYFLWFEMKPRESLKRETGYLGTKGLGGAFSQWKSDTAFRSTLSGRRYLMIFPAHSIKKDAQSIVCKATKLLARAHCFTRPKANEERGFHAKHSLQPSPGLIYLCNKIHQNRFNDLVVKAYQTNKLIFRFIILICYDHYVMPVLAILLLFWTDC